MTKFIRHDVIKTPKDRLVIIAGYLYGQEIDKDRKENSLYPKGIITCIGYYDMIDDAYALTCTPYYGPFIEPVEWCELPK
jgi:hypothetical protein